MSTPLRTPLRFLCLAGLAGALATLAACSGPLVRDAPDVQRPGAFPNHSADAILRAVALSAQPLVAFESRSRIEVERPGQRGAVTARLQQTSDSLYGKLSGPFGIRIGEGLVTPDSFYVDYSFGGAYYTGALHAAGRAIPIPATSAELFASVTGTLVPRFGVTWSVTSDSARYFLSAPLAGAGPGAEQRLTIDPGLWRVVEAVEVGADGRILGIRSFSAFDQIDGVVLPRRIVLHAPQDEATVTIEHLSVTPNPASLAFPRPSPGNADVTVIE